MLIEVAFLSYNHLKYSKGDFPITEEQSDSQLSLPIYPEMTYDEIDYICNTINEIVKEMK